MIFSYLSFVVKQYRLTQTHTDSTNIDYIHIGNCRYEKITMYKFPDGEEVSRALLPTSCRLHWDLEMVSKIKYLSIATNVLY